VVEKRIPAHLKLEIRYSFLPDITAGDFSAAALDERWRTENSGQ